MSSKNFSPLKLLLLAVLTNVLFIGCFVKPSNQNIYPYSMVEYQPGKFIDDSEITVEQWAEFVFDSNEQHKPDSLMTLDFKYHNLFYPNKKADSLYHAFGKIGYYKLPVVKEYFDTLNYSQLREILDYPITAISYDDVVDYCHWRTKKYNQNNTEFTSKEINFVLPDQVIVEPLDSLFTINKNGRPIPVANFKQSEYNRKKDAPKNLIFLEIGHVPIRVKSFPANQNGVYDLWGNVSEMTAEQGVAFGGSYLDNFPLEKTYSAYNKKQVWLGFRCVGLVSPN